MADTSLPRRGGARRFFASVGSLVSARVFLGLSQILVLPVLARQLTVEDFALMAMAMTVVIFSSVLSDAGLGRSLIRMPRDDPDEWSSVFWLLVAVGLGLGLAVLAIAPLWALFFGEPRLAWMLCALAVVPLAQALSAAPNAEVERREDYAGIARMQMTTTVVGLVVALGLAWVGAGVWALVGQQVALALARLAGIVGLSRFRPTLVFRRRLLDGHLRFARDAIAVSLVGALRAQAAVVAVGKLLGPAPLGVLAMSNRFARLPQFGLAGPASTVVYVRMSKAQADPERLASLYLASTRLLALALFPPLAMLAVAGGPAFTLFLGQGWAPVAPVFALSITGLALEAVTMVCLACLLRAVGRTDLQLRLSVEGAVLRVALVSAAALHGLEAVAAALTVWGLLYVPRGWLVARRVAPLSVRGCVGALAGPVLAAGAAALLHVGLRALMSPGPVAEVAMAAVLGLAAMAAAWAAERTRVARAVAAFRD